MARTSQKLSGLQNRLVAAQQAAAALPAEAGEGASCRAALCKEAAELGKHLMWHVCLYAGISLFRLPQLRPPQKEKLKTILQTMASNIPSFGTALWSVRRS
jgi:hypothetical protein